MTSLLLSMSLLLACGEDDHVDDSHDHETDTDTDTDADSDTDADTDADTDTDVTWDEMSFDDKKTYMQEVVNPAMKTAFQDHNADHYADFGCATCHGSGAGDGSFSMPNDIVGLDPANIPAYGEYPSVDFMYDTVVPDMAEMLDTTPYDPKTGEGFGCFNCHPAETPK